MTIFECDCKPNAGSNATSAEQTFQTGQLVRFFLTLLISWAVSPTAFSALLAQNSNTFDDLESIDKKVAEYMRIVNATAATVAVTFEGNLVYCKGYGFSDRNNRVETLPRTTMRIASCTKPFTAAAIQELIARGDITQDTRVFDYLGIRPFQQLKDDRIKQITIGHLLDHEAGWDREQTTDPMYQIPEIKKDLRVRKVQKRHIVRYMWKQPLQADPGTRRYYSNFGYVLLGLVIEKATGKSYIKSIRELIAGPIEADDISISSPVKSNRKSREVHYPNDNKLDFHIRDSASGLATSSETLCKFMNNYWLDGTQKNSRRQYFYQFGTHPFTTTTLMEQRLDGFHFAIMMNSRRNDHYNEDNEAIRKSFNSLLDSVKNDLKDR